MNSRFPSACGVLLAVVLLAGCGGDGPTAAEKRMDARFAELDSAMASITVNAPPYIENLERLTRQYIEAIHEYDDDLGDDEVKRRLADKAAEVQAYCLPCAGMLDRERETY